MEAPLIPVLVEVIASRRKEVVDIMIAVTGQAKLLEVVGALHAVGGLTHLLHRGQEQADQHRDDGNHHQELNEGEGPT